MKKNKKNIEKKPMKDWEKKFIFFNILTIFIICSIYSYKLIHYYRLEHKQSFLTTNNLYETLKNKPITYNNSGLYKIDNNYYYKGKVTDNYLYYSARLWRIISFNDNGIKLITEDTQTSMVWSTENNYKDSYIYNWLNITDKEHSGIFINSLNNYKNYLIKHSWCTDIVTKDNQTCNDTLNNYVGLISIEEYLKAGGIESYLNNNNYFWTINASENNIWYIFDKGGINDETNDDTGYHSYGVRPSIVLDINTPLYKGDGTKDNPYIIENDNSVILNHKSIGSYIKYNDNLFRIIEKNDDYIKLTLAYHLEGSKVNYNNINQYLNNVLLNKLEKNNLVKCPFYGGNYSKDNNYDYKEIYNKKEYSYIGLPSVTELFITDDSDIWLNNYNNNSLIYTTNTLGRLFLDNNDNLHYLKPSICINGNITILSGSGTNNDPYVLEE